MLATRFFPARVLAGRTDSRRTAQTQDAGARHTSHAVAIPARRSEALRCGLREPPSHRSFLIYHPPLTKAGAPIKAARDAKDVSTSARNWANDLQSLSEGLPCGFEHHLRHGTAVVAFHAARWRREPRCLPCRHHASLGGVRLMRMQSSAGTCLHHTPCFARRAAGLHAGREQGREAIPVMSAMWSRQGSRQRLGASGGLRGCLTSGSKLLDGWCGGKDAGPERINDRSPDRLAGRIGCRPVPVATSRRRQTQKRAARLGCAVLLRLRGAL